MTERLLDATDLRREARVAVNAPTSLEIAGRAPCVGRVENISRHGVLIANDASPVVNDRVTIDLPGQGMTDCVVVWTAEGRFGCQFTAAIPVASFATLLAGLEAG